jgi:hypothetical protein
VLPAVSEKVRCSSTQHKQFDVPKGTLKRHVKNNTKSLDEPDKVNLERRPILPNHTERKLAKDLMRWLPDIMG